jgi:DegV family protein with EDD domain
VFHQIYQELLDMGHDIFVITISSKLSGFNASANLAKKDFPDANIEVLDSMTGAGAVALVMDRVIAAAKNGASPQELKEMAKAQCENTELVLMPETLEYLYRGGRIGGAAKFLGTALKTLPILEVQEGAFEGVERVRTHTKALKRLVELAAERVAGRSPVHVKVLNANAPELAQQVLDSFMAKVDVASSGITEVSPGVGVHLGPGTVGISFLAGFE